MKKYFVGILVVFGVFCLSAWPHAPTKLLLIGGGPHPKEVISRFVNEAGRSQAQILVVTWATDFPDQAMGQMVKEFGSYPGVKVLEAPRRPLNQESRNLFLRELSGATGLFFTGGDQSKIISVASDLSVRKALYKFYFEGHVIGGTSAGTAVMSPIMFTGRNNEVKPGLGLLPGTLLDTHFLVRARVGRLSAVIHEYPQLTGLGIDEGNAVWITEGRHVEVFGPTLLTLIKTNPDGSQMKKSFKAGQFFKMELGF